MDPQTHKTAADIWHEIVRIGLPGFFFTVIAWFIVRTILLKVELDGPGFTMKAEKSQVADMLSDLLNDVRGLTREEKDLFMRVRNRQSRSPRVLVSDVFPDFKEGTDEHRMLRSLQCSHLIRPMRGNPWQPDSIIQITVFGERLVQARPNLFSPAGQPLVS